MELAGPKQKETKNQAKQQIIWWRAKLMTLTTTHPSQETPHSAETKGHKLTVSKTRRSESSWISAAAATHLRTTRQLPLSTDHGLLMMNIDGATRWPASVNNGLCENVSYRDWCWIDRGAPRRQRLALLRCPGKQLPRAGGRKLWLEQSRQNTDAMTLPMICRVSFVRCQILCLGKLPQNGMKYKMLEGAQCPHLPFGNSASEDGGKHHKSPSSSDWTISSRDGPRKQR